MKSNGPLAALFGLGIYRLTPLRKRLWKLIDEPMLARVAEERRAGRRLYIGTTDLTRGRVVTWNMGAIAADDSDDRRERYISVLLASSSVPGVIEPVVVRDEQGNSKLHGDGATKVPLLFEPTMMDPRCLGRATVWAIANGHVCWEGATVVAPKRTLAVARRGVSQLMRRFLYTVTLATADRVRETVTRFRLLALPDTVPEAISPFEFVPSEMAALYEEGVRLGRNPAAWTSAPNASQAHGTRTGQNTRPKTIQTIGR